MPQINTGKSIPAGKPLPFNAGDILTAADLNEMMDSATLSTGAILNQTNIAAGTVASNDSILLYDLSATALREAAVNDILCSSLPVIASTVTATSVVTSVVNAEANSDILITPNDGTNVTGKTFSSSNGITVTIASTAHGLVTGQNVTITASNSAYSGTYKITVTTVDAFTYVLFPVSTADSGTCSYVREGSVRINGELNVSAGLNIAGNTTLSGALISSGTTNFTGALQVNGTVGYMLTGVVEETIAVNITTQGALDTVNTYFTSASYTKPVDEIWVIEVCANITHNSGSYYGIRLKQSSTSSIIDGDFFVDFVDTVRPNRMNRFYAKGVISAATTFTSTFVIEASLYGSGTHGIGHTNYSSAVAGVLTTFNIASSVFRIYKYKTA